MSSAGVGGGGREPPKKPSDLPEDREKIKERRKIAKERRRARRQEVTENRRQSQRLQDQRRREEALTAGGVFSQRMATAIQTAIHSAMIEFTSQYMQDSGLAGNWRENQARGGGSGLGARGGRARGRRDGWRGRMNQDRGQAAWQGHGRGAANAGSVVAAQQPASELQALAVTQVEYNNLQVEEPPPTDGALILQDALASGAAGLPDNPDEVSIQEVVEGQQPV
ncbi:hypothetical protein N7532_001505 [Penicillium argentinense]|uniref:Uncharacterized protein n=1 Tax=Penicillium argentinense TaxID=1131581 RepID=A0A9W9KLU5_9EURO|nr:uncharacterized protein N7532_001505 [Penicillium argentinense]KAJ5110970.1 hypothetical protein N7532_001505 [Penicillium argentinense]